MNSLNCQECLYFDDSIVIGVISHHKHTVIAVGRARGSFSCLSVCRSLGL